MSETLSLNFSMPILSVQVSPDAKAGAERSGGASDAEVNEYIKQQAAVNLEQKKDEMTHVLAAMDKAAGEVKQAHEKAFSEYPGQIAKLSVEIAKRILSQSVDRGDYDIEEIIKKTLTVAPTSDNCVVKLNPVDMQKAQELLGEKPDSIAANIRFISDEGIGRAQCVLETPKGIVEYFIDDQLNRIAEAIGAVN